MVWADISKSIFYQPPWKANYKLKSILLHTISRLHYNVSSRLKHLVTLYSCFNSPFFISVHIFGSFIPGNFTACYEELSPWTCVLCYRRIKDIKETFIFDAIDIDSAFLCHGLCAFSIYIKNVSMKNKKMFAINSFYRNLIFISIT